MLNSSTEGGETVPLMIDKIGTLVAIDAFGELESEFFCPSEATFLLFLFFIRRHEITTMKPDKIRSPIVKIRRSVRSAIPAKIPISEKCIFHDNFYDNDHFIII